MCDTQRAVRRLIAASGILSGLVSLGLLVVHLDTGSVLALAQSAESLSDVLAAGMLAYAVRVSEQPPDDRHPLGHHAAQPAAALIVAVLTGALAVEVVREAASELWLGPSGTMGVGIAVLLGVKVVGKVALAVLAQRLIAKRAQSALEAFRVDARNDALVGTVGLAGVGVGAIGLEGSVDAWLAIPVALWIVVAGVRLGRESLSLLMGTAPALERQDELRVAAAEVKGVEHIASLSAVSHGDLLSLWVEAHVDGALRVRQAHDIGEAVEARLLKEPDVTRAVVHVDAAVPRTQATDAGDSKKPQLKSRSR